MLKLILFLLLFFVEENFAHIRDTQVAAATVEGAAA